MGDICKTLNERHEKYGCFKNQANISRRLKGVMFATEGWQYLSWDKKEALEMIQHKISRILNGDPDYADSWHDIQGYARLIEDSIINDED